MRLTPDQWKQLRTAVELDDEKSFEHLINEIGKTIARDEVARRTQRRQAGYVNDQPYCVLDR